MNKKYKYLIIILLIVFSLIAFGRIINNDFINFDDGEYITGNNHIKSGINKESIKWAFSSSYAANWHPLTWMSHMLDWRFFKGNAGFYHLINLLLHIGAALFLFLFLNKTTKSLWSSAFVAAVFALHPLRVESVAWASERKDVLSMFFGMATLYAYAFYVENKKISKYFLCLLLFILSLMSKPMLVTLPFVLLLLDYWPLGRWQKALNPPPNDKTRVAISQPQKKKGKKCKADIVGEKKIATPAGNRPSVTRFLLWEKVPFLFLSIILSIVTMWAQSEGIPYLDNLLFSDRIINALVSYVAYLGKIFWPVGLAIFYPYQSLLSSWQIFGAALILTGITTVVVFSIKRAPFLFVGWFWYLGTLVPVIGLVQVGRQALADRYTYLPSIGIALMLVWGLLYLVPKERLRKMILLPAAGIVLFVLTILTWQQCGYWRNSISVFRHAVNVTDDNYLAHDILGFALFAEGKNEEAISHYLTAIEINPFCDIAYNNLGMAMAAQGKNEEAMAHYLKAIKINPANDQAHGNLGWALAAQGKNEEAMAHYLEAIKINPTNALAHYALANLLIKQGKMDEATNHYREAIKINPEYDRAHYNLAEVLVKQDSIDQAIEHFREAVRIKPSFAALNNLGVNLEKQLKHDEAIHFYRLALPLEPQNPGLHFNLGVALGNKGEFSQATEHFRRAIELKPDFEQARRALKLALELEKQKNE